MGILLIFVGLFGMGVALTAVIRGRLAWAHLRSRGMAGLVLAGAVIVTVVGANLSSAATTPQPVAAPAPTTTVATVVPTTTTVVPTTTTVAPTTTTTTVKVVTPTRTHTVVRTTTHTATHTTPPAPSFTCSASMSNPHPSHNETTDVVVRTGRSGAAVDAVAHYKSKDTEHEVHGSGSTVDVPFDISTATYDYTVDVDVTVEVGGLTKSCGTSFTPEAP